MRTDRLKYYYIALAALFMLFHWPVLFGGKVYMNMWIFRDHAPFPAALPSQLNPLNQSSDFVTHYFGYMEFVARSFRQGLFPPLEPLSSVRVSHVRGFSGNGFFAVQCPFLFHGPLPRL